MKPSNSVQFRVFYTFIFLLFFSYCFGNEPQKDNSGEEHQENSEATHEEKEGFNPGDMILHHIKDDHLWHFMTIGQTHITLYLPVILISPKHGLSVFMSSKFEHNPDHIYNGYAYQHGKITSVDGSTFYDFSLTKNVLAMIISGVLLLLIFVRIGKKYSENYNRAPRGLQNFLEIVILFIRDEVAKPFLGERYTKYFSYIITIFFFIWINNLLGLLPGWANVTGNIAVTGSLSILTLIIVNVSGNKYYWGHIFKPPVPVWLYPIMWIVEIISIFTKPFALMIRLFANITAGHILILSMVGLIFIFGQMSHMTGWAVSPVSIAFGVFLFMLELLVGAIQAFIFALLSAAFIAQAIEVHHDHNHEEAVA